MSGPKCSSYSVRADAAVRRRRELERLRERATRATRQLAALMAELEGKRSFYGEHLRCNVRAPTGDIARMETDQLERHMAELAEASEAARTALHEGVATARRSFLESQIESRDVAGRSSDDRLAALAESLRQTVSVDRRLGEFVELLSRIDASVPQEVVEGLAESIDRAATGGQVTVDALLVDLRHRVTEANATARRAEEVDVILDDFELELAGRSGIEVSLAEAAIASARETLEIGPELEAMVARAVAADEEQAEEQMVLAAAAEVLADMGYAVGAEFETLQSGAFTDIEKPDWGEYALRVRRLDDSRQLAFNVIRTHDSSVPDRRRADHAAEVRWCEDYHRLGEELDRVGVELDLVSARPAGERAVAVTHSADAETDRAESRRQEQARRSRPLKEMGS